MTLLHARSNQDWTGRATAPVGCPFPARKPHRHPAVEDLIRLVLDAGPPLREEVLRRLRDYHPTVTVPLQDGRRAIERSVSYFVNAGGAQRQVEAARSAVHALLPVGRLTRQEARALGYPIPVSRPRMGTIWVVDELQGLIVAEVLATLDDLGARPPVPPSSSGWTRGQPPPAACVDHEADVRPVVRAGRQWTTCPFHDDRIPSARMFPEGPIYCYGCRRTVGFAQHPNSVPVHVQFLRADWRERKLSLAPPQGSYPAGYWRSRRGARGLPAQRRRAKIEIRDSRFEIQHSAFGDQDPSIDQDRSYSPQPSPPVATPPPVPAPEAPGEVSISPSPSPYSNADFSAISFMDGLASTSEYDAAMDSGAVVCVGLIPRPQDDDGHQPSPRRWVKTATAGALRHTHYEGEQFSTRRVAARRSTLEVLHVDATRLCGPKARALVSTPGLDGSVFPTHYVGTGPWIATTSSVQPVRRFSKPSEHGRSDFSLYAESNPRSLFVSGFVVDVDGAAQPADADRRLAAIGRRAEALAGCVRGLSGKVATVLSSDSGAQVYFELRLCHHAEQFFSSRRVRCGLRKLADWFLGELHAEGFTGGTVDESVWRPCALMRRPGPRWTKPTPEHQEGRAFCAVVPYASAVGKRPVIDYSVRHPLDPKRRH